MIPPAPQAPGPETRGALRLLSKLRANSFPSRRHHQNGPANVDEASCAPERPKPLPPKRVIALVAIELYSPLDALFVSQPVADQGPH